MLVVVIRLICETSGLQPGSLLIVFCLLSFGPAFPPYRGGFEDAIVEMYIWMRQALNSHHLLTTTSI